MYIDSFLVQAVEILLFITLRFLLLGPLTKFKQTIRRSVQDKWHPSRVLQVGMMTPTLSQLWSSTSTSNDRQLYFQWCFAHESMFHRDCRVVDGGSDAGTCSDIGSTPTSRTLANMISQGPPSDALEGLVPWLSVGPALATSSACETILIDNF